MKNFFLLFCLFLLGKNALQAQTIKPTVYGEIGMGFGQTLFFDDMKARLAESYGGSFDPKIGSNLMVGFFFSPEKWRGLGIGTRVKGTFGSSVTGDFGDSYIINYYSVALQAKYHFWKQQFNKGPFVRATYGFGQMTTKRMNEATNFYKHQYAIGGTVMGSLGWSFPIGKTALSIEAEFEFSTRNGTIDGVGEARYKSGQIGGNLVFSF